MNRRPPKKGVKKTTTTNTLLVDGNALFKTGYHGAKNEFNGRGEHIGGLYQFITILRKLLMEDLYHKVYVFWDGRFSGKLRYEIYKPYKSGRGKDYINGTEPEDEVLKLQRFMVQEYLEELFIRQIEDDIVEGDDFIAFYVKTRNENEKITICTNDRDLCQLVGKDVRIYLCDKKSFVTDYNFYEHFNYHQKNALLFKVISGDDSDTILGIKLVKAKTLLKHFPELATQPLTIEDIIQKSKELQNERLINKKKPLAALDNIINCVTDGVQGKNLYTVNTALMDLSAPMMTHEGLEKLTLLMESSIDPEDRGIKNVYSKMRRDGLVDKIGDHNVNDYLMPYKKLIEREKQLFKNEKNEN